MRFMGRTKLPFKMPPSSTQATPEMGIALMVAAPPALSRPRLSTAASCQIPEAPVVGGVGLRNGEFTSPCGGVKPPLHQPTDYRSSSFRPPREPARAVLSG